MHSLPDPEIARAARTTRPRHAFVSCTGATLGLAMLVMGTAAHAQQPLPPPPPPPSTTTQAAPPTAPSTTAPAAPPAAPQAAPQGTAGQTQPQMQPPPGYAPPQGYPPQGYGPPPQGYPPQGYGPPPQGYPPGGGYYVPPQGDGQTPPQGYGYPYPYYGPYYGPPGPAVPAGPPPQRYERNSTGMFVGGIALTTAGIIGLLVGSGLASTASSQIPVYCDQGFGVTICEYRTDEAQQAAGIGVLVGGLVAIGVGIPLWIIGGKRVPVKDKAPNDAPAEGEKKTGLELLVSPKSAGLRLTF